MARGRKSRKLPKSMQVRPEDHLLWLGQDPVIVDPDKTADSASDLKRALVRFDDPAPDIDPETAGRILAKFFMWSRLWPEFAPVLQTAYEMYILRDALRLAASCQAFAELYGRLPALPSLYGAPSVEKGIPFAVSDVRAQQAYVRMHRLGHRIHVHHRLRQSALGRLARPDLPDSQRKMAEKQAEVSASELEAALQEFARVWSSSAEAAREYMRKACFSKGARRVLDLAGIRFEPPEESREKRSFLDAALQASDGSADPVPVLDEGRSLMNRLRRMAEEAARPDDDLEGLERLMGEMDETSGGQL